jgi:hypothetical protein
MAVVRPRRALAAALGCLALSAAVAVLGLLSWRAARSDVRHLGPGGSPDERLVAAARAGDAAAVRSLVAAGADPDLPMPGNGWTPLIHAVHTRSRAGVRALLEAGADPNRTGSGGQRPLLMAAGYGEAELVALLLAGGADPHLGGQGWRNALEAALTGSLDIDGLTFARCQPDTVRVLVGHSPDLVATGPAGHLGRFLVYARGCDEVERLLEAPPPPVVSPGR